MTFYPFFVNVAFEGPPDEATPFTPVSRVDLGYIGNDGLDVSRLDDWKEIADWIRSFQKLGRTVPVGYSLRNLSWPALTANLVRSGERVPGIMMQMDRKWNDLPMIDLQQLLVQGGYSDWKPSLLEACRFFGVQCYPTNPIASMYDLYRIYQKVS